MDTSFLSLPQVQTSPSLDDKQGDGYGWPYTGDILRGTVPTELSEQQREAAIQRAIRQINVHEDGYRECIRLFDETDKPVYLKAADSHRVLSQYAARMAAELIAGRRKEQA